MNYLSDKRLCELLGTATLILVGCGAIAVGGFGPAFPVGILPVALAFGLAVMAMACAIGPVSGCHINPAVTAAMWAAGRISSEEAVGYVVAQLIGGIVGAFILWVILKGKIAGYDARAMQPIFIGNTVALNGRITGDVAELWASSPDSASHYRVNIAIKRAWRWLAVRSRASAWSISPPWWSARPRR